MKKVKPQHFIIDTAQFNQNCLVCINYKSPQVLKAYKSFLDTDPLPQSMLDIIDSKKPGTGLFLYHSSPNHRIILLFPQNKTQAFLLFDHEKLHALHHLMTHIGMKLNNHTEEAYAYTSAYMLKQFMNLLK